MGLNGLEPSTSRLSGVRSNQLSYKPIKSGTHLLSHAVSSIVPSAAYVLTIVFGMGTGVSHKRIGTGNIIFCYAKDIESCSAASPRTSLPLLLLLAKALSVP